MYSVPVLEVAVRPPAGMLARIFLRASLRARSARPACCFMRALAHSQADTDEATALAAAAKAEVSPSGARLSIPHTARYIKVLRHKDTDEATALAAAAKAEMSRRARPPAAAGVEAPSPSVNPAARACAVVHGGDATAPYARWTQNWPPRRRRSRARCLMK
jgi:hypothetical protein